MGGFHKVLVTSCSALISRTRSIWFKRRFNNRKLPPVIGMIIATVSGSQGCFGRFTPDGIQPWSKSCRISAAARVRNSWDESDA